MWARQRLGPARWLRSHIFQTSIYSGGWDQVFNQTKVIFLVCWKN